MPAQDSHLLNPQQEIQGQAQEMSQLHHFEKTIPTQTQSTKTSTTNNNNNSSLIGGKWNPEWNKNVAQLHTDARIKTVSDPSLKNPLTLKDPLDRQAASYAKALRVVNSDWFKKLDDKGKDYALGRYYQKYVVPAYANTTANVPGYHIWKRGMLAAPANHMSVSDFYLNRGQNADALTDAKAAFLNMGASATKVLANIMNGAIAAGVKADGAIFGLQPYFNTPKSQLEQEAAAGDKKADDALNELKLMPRELMKQNQAAIDSANFWFEMHPSKTFMERTGSFVGEQASQLPLYEAIGALRTLGPIGKMGDAIISGASRPTVAAGRAAQAANFTRRLLATPTGRFIGRRLGEAADAYIGGTLQRQDEPDKIGAILSFMGLGTINEGATAGLKLIARSAMKRQLAHDAAIGGVPYIVELGRRAEHELNEGILGHDTAGNDVKPPEDATNEELKVAFQHIHDADPVKTKIVTAAKMSLTSIAKEIHGPDTKWRDLSHSQRNRIRREYQRRAAEAISELPVHVPEVAQHEAQESVKASAAESPVFSQFAARINQVTSRRGITVENALADQEIERVKDQTGLRSVQGATSKAENRATEIASQYKVAKVDRDTTVVKPVDTKTRAQKIFNDLPDSGNMKYNSGDQSYNVKFASPVDKALYRLAAIQKQGIFTGKPGNLEKYNSLLARLRQYFPDDTDDLIFNKAQDIKAQLDAEIKDRRPRYNSNPKEQNVLFPAKYDTDTPLAAYEPEPRNYVSFRTNALAPLRNTFANAAKATNTSLADYLRDLSDEDLIEEVKDQTGHAIHFEKPFDLMLWTFHHGDDLPAPLYNRIVNWLRDEDPTQNIESLKKQSQILDHHIELLAYSGRLDSEGNVFRSTVTSGWKNRTVWQKQLLEEVSAQEVADYEKVMGPYANNWPTEYKFGLQMLSTMQQARSRSSSLKAAIEKTDTIRDSIMKAREFGKGKK